jgi:hypothetical protein
MSPRGNDLFRLAQVGSDRLCGFGGAVDYDDFTGAATNHGGNRAGATDVAGSNNLDFHLGFVPVRERSCL